MVNRSVDVAKMCFDESKTHIFSNPFFKYISSLKSSFKGKLWSFYLDLCFAETKRKEAEFNIKWGRNQHCTEKGPMSRH